MADPAPLPTSEPVLPATRRQVLAGASALALAAAAPPVTAEPDEAWRGEPFDDGTWFDDGYGWVD